jgi:hypothetical protein
MRTSKADAELKQFLALGAKIARRLEKQDVQIRLEIHFGPKSPLASSKLKTTKTRF